MSGFFVLNNQAQESVGRTVEQIIADIYEQVSENSDVEIDFTNFYEDMIFFSENPINLNRASKEELDKLQFLSDIQIDNMLHYFYRYAPLNTIYELQLIDGLDMTDIQYLLPFVMLGDAEAKKETLRMRDVFRYGRNELYIRLDRGLETKEGYRFVPEEEAQAEEKNARKYVGDPFYNHLKYRFRYRDRVAFGVTAEKDAGEQFWGEYNKGYDFYSAHLELKNFGKLKTLVLGDFRANFGQGLVMRTDFSMGKSSYVLQVNPRTSGLKKYTSTDEYNFFRGAGGTVNLGKFDISAFYSNKQIDGDTVNGVFASIKSDGLHRTQIDLQRKRNVNMQVIGGNITFTHSWFQIGATTVHTALNHSLEPRPANYNKFYFRGKNQTVSSVNYRARVSKLNIFGETAISDREGGWATTNGVNFSPISRVALVALYRYFSKEYDAFFATSFSESSRINNETGFYLGAEVRPIKYWKVSAYIDSYRFPWMKFGIDAPSIGKDYLVQLDYAPRRTLNMYWRFKFEEKMSNYSDTATVMPVVLPQQKWNARYLLNYSFGRFIFRNQLDVNSFYNEEKAPSYGYSALQDVSYQFQKIPLRLDVRFHIFDAQNFENRLYIYEKDVLYAFSVPMNYGLGSRYYVNLRYEVNRNLSFWMKLAQTVYADDRVSISSSNEEILGNRKTDFRFLMRLKF
ncbi:MAG: helix-hairpin-helix domain-containing protein [Porphyromonadaceae bacterium]|nr:helix-hairpin-helix domain-containing protein [Porphyromonadaceae bacterium]